MSIHCCNINRNWCRNVPSAYLHRGSPCQEAQNLNLDTCACCLAGKAMQPTSSQAAMPAELMQKHDHGVGPVAQDPGSHRLPVDHRSAQGADVALSAHLLTAPNAASWPSTAHSTDFNASSDLDACCNGMQVMPQARPAASCNVPCNLSSTITAGRRVLSLQRHMSSCRDLT